MMSPYMYDRTGTSTCYSVVDSPTAVWMGASKESPPVPNNKKEKPWHKFTKRRHDGKFSK